MKKDVVILCQFFYPEYISSAVLPTQMAEDFARNGLSVSVVCGYPYEYYEGEKVSKRETYHNIDIRRMKYIQMRRTTKYGRFASYFSILFSTLLKIPFILKHKCIIVYSNPPLLPVIPAILNIIFKTKFIFVAYDIYPDIALLLKAISKGSMIEKLMCIVNRLVYKRAARIVALGNEMKELMLSNKTDDSDKIIVIPNWYDQGTVSTYPHQIDIQIKDIAASGKFIVLYGGNMGQCQDIDTIMKASLLLKEHDDIMFVFAGHGSKIRHLKKFKEENKLQNIMLFGFIKGDDYSAMLESADCCLLSLESGSEGMGVPSKTYSYLFSSRPVLAIISEKTDIASELIGYQAGYVIKSGDAKDLAHCILTLKNDEGLKVAMGKNARKLHEDKYSRSASTAKYIKCVKEVIQKPLRGKKRENIIDIR